MVSSRCSIITAHLHHYLLTISDQQAWHHSCAHCSLQCSISGPQKCIIWFWSLYKELFCCHCCCFCVQSLSHIQPFASPRTQAQQISLSFSIPQSLFKFMSIELVVLSNHFIICYPLVLLPSIFPSMSLFQWDNTLHPEAKLLELQLHHGWFLLGSPCSPRYSQECSLTTNLKASNLQCSAFFIIQLSHPYMTTGKGIALTIQISVSFLICSLILP